MNDRVHVPATITVGVDGTPASIAALRWAIALAERTGASIEAVMAWRYPFLATMPGLIGAVPPVADMETAALQGLDKILGSVHTEVHIEPVATMGSGSQVLIDASRGQDLLVVGRRGNGGLRGLGSTSRHCSIHAPTSVAVIPDGAEPLVSDPSVMVAVDGSPHSIDAMVWAARAFAPNAKIAVSHSHDEQMLDYHDLPEEVRDGLQSARASASPTRSTGRWFGSTRPSTSSNTCTKAIPARPSSMPHGASTCSSSVTGATQVSEGSYWARSPRMPSATPRYPW